MPTILAEKPILAEKTSLAARLRARKPLPLPLWLCLYGVAVLFVGIATAAGELQNADFLATNGDYQTYNVLRRAIAGQVPYLDFANYLGMGPLLTIAPAVRLWNQLQGSMFFATCATACMFTLFAGLVLFLVSGHKTASAAASILLPKLLTSGLIKSFVPFYGYYANYYFELLIYPQKSLRMVRLFLAVLLTVAALLVRRRCRGRLSEVLGGWKAAPLFGFVLGLGIVWSNDFGVACIAAGFVVLLALWVKSAWGRPLPVLQVLGRCMLWLAGVAVGILLSATLATKGHPMAWWSFTRDVSSWQFWYFDKTPLLTVGALLGEKRMLAHLVLVVVLAVVCLVRLVQGRLGDRLLLFGFLSAAIAGSAMVYMVGSGNFDFPEGLYCLLLLAAAGALLRLGLWLAERFWPVAQPYIPLACTLAAAGFCLFYLRSAQSDVAAYARVDVHADDYVEALGNRLPVHAGALKDMYAASEGGTLFSEYATGLTDMRGEIQPGSCDYIIHALGDDLHAAYTEDFAAGNYDFVQTIDPEKSPWDFWIFRCNWDFYKELYANYNIQGYYGAWRLWQHLPEGQSNTVTANNTVTVNPQGRGMVEILVESDYQGNCLADVTLDYESAFVSNLYRLQTWNRTVLAIDETNYPEYYYLPKADSEHTVSVTLNEGWGRIVLLALPEQCTTLEVRATVSPLLYPNAEVAPDP